MLIMPLIVMFFPLSDSVLSEMFFPIRVALARSLNWKKIVQKVFALTCRLNLYTFENALHMPLDELVLTNGI